MQNIGGICLRLEYIAARVDEPNSEYETPGSFDWVVEGVEDSDRENLIRILDHIVGRIEVRTTGFHATKT